MVKVVKNYRVIHKKTGRKNKLTIENQILLTLNYFGQYTTYFALGKKFNLDESNVYRTIQKIEKILIMSGVFALPGKKELRPQKLSETNNRTIVIDVTETEIQRPQKNQKKSYSGKKKRHTKKLK